MLQIKHFKNCKGNLLFNLKNSLFTLLYHLSIGCVHIKTNKEDRLEGVGMGMLEADHQRGTLCDRFWGTFLTLSDGSRVGSSSKNEGNWQSG